MKFKDSAVGHRFTRNSIPPQGGLAIPIWMKTEEIAFQNAVPITGGRAGYMEHIHPDAPISLAEE